MAYWERAWLRRFKVPLGLGLLALAGCSYVLFMGQQHPKEPQGPAGPAAVPLTRVDTSLPPGALPFSDALKSELADAWARRRPDYAPRTKHLKASGAPKYTNRLFLESSPYLLQHAHNPVNWLPWSEEAFELARKLGRPVLVSVGYSTCHWCHVMEEESFEDEEIAEFINRHYIALKVDREERPDIDSIYMSAVQLLNGGGGWPMTVWLTADKTPVFAGTYFPARDGDRGTRVGFLTLLLRLEEAFRNKPADVIARAQQIASQVKSALEASSPGRLATPRVLHAAASFYASRFDSERGGLQGAPKFPSSLPVRFLLRYHRRTGDEKALEMAILTLEQMAAGGMYDHVAGGFHRYSTDADWLVPHFEKMLYDNALLAVAYLEAHQVASDHGFAQIAREILDYVAREMTSPEGGFYSATDADSLGPNGRRDEGWFFTWTPDELATVLGPQLAPLAADYYGVTKSGNFEGRSILHTARTLTSVAGSLGIPEDAATENLQIIKQRLYAARLKRPQPLRDDKILTAWNGLMISAFARAGLILDDASYVERAKQAATFLLQHRSEGKYLQRSVKPGQVALHAYLDDYAFLIAGLLDLYEASHQVEWLERALELNQILDTDYRDEQPGYYLTSVHHEVLLARQKPAYDGAEPSGNSVQALNLLRLYELTTEERFRERADATMSAFADQLERSPASLSELLLAVDFRSDAAKEIVIVVPERIEQSATLMAVLRHQFTPNRVLSVVTALATQGQHARTVPLLEAKVAHDGLATAYVCEHGACELPTTDPALFATQLAKVTPLSLPQ